VQRAGADSGLAGTVPSRAILKLHLLPGAPPHNPPAPLACASSIRFCLRPGNSPRRTNGSRAALGKCERLWRPATHTTAAALRPPPCVCLRAAAGPHLLTPALHVSALCFRLRRGCHRRPAPAANLCFRSARCPHQGRKKSSGAILGQNLACGTRAYIRTDARTQVTHIHARARAHTHTHTHTHTRNPYTLRKIRSGFTNWLFCTAAAFACVPECGLPRASRGTRAARTRRLCVPANFAFPGRRRRRLGEWRSRLSGSPRARRVSCTIPDLRCGCSRRGRRARRGPQTAQRGRLGAAPTGASMPPRSPRCPGAAVVGLRGAGAPADRAKPPAAKAHSGCKHAAGLGFKFLVPAAAQPAGQARRCGRYRMQQHREPLLNPE
jgi:hypothetical protein